MNVAAFAWGSVGDVGVVLLSGEDVANTKEVEELIYYTSQDGREGKISIRVTDFTEGEIFLNGFLIQSLLQSVPKTIIRKFCWS